MRDVAILSLIIAAAPAIAADASRPSPQDRVCRSIENTGSRITGRECHSRSEWMEIDAERRKQYELFNQNMARGAASERPISTSPYPR